MVASRNLLQTDEKIMTRQSCRAAWTVTAALFCIYHSLLIAEDASAPAKRNGCLDCHGSGPKKSGPSFHEIATRYRDRPEEYQLSVVSGNSVTDLPQGLRSRVVVADLQKNIHVRIFDKHGQIVVDKGDSELNGLTLDMFNELLPATAANPEARSSLLHKVQLAAGYTESKVRSQLIETVKNGGKGHWTKISRGIAMPPFSRRLSEKEIGSLVDQILQTKLLKVMTKGLGEGTVKSTNGEIDWPTDGEEAYAEPRSIELTAVSSPGSRFVEWEGDATGNNPTVTLNMDADRSVRAVFDLDPGIPPLTEFTPEGIRQYLASNPIVNTPARFLNALPIEFKQNWILMTRSESLQTGTAESPRLLLPSASLDRVFTIGLKSHGSYPGSHPNAIEYMQWDGCDKNFRFHEIVLSDIPEIAVTMPGGSTRNTIPSRPRGISVDDQKCFKCHSTQNVRNPSTFPGTTGISPGTVKFKSKPNWDTYDSWGGMLPFNRDRIYQGSIEVAAFRQFFNPWTWSKSPEIREIVEQLSLQPPNVTTKDDIVRHRAGTYEGHLKFAFDPEIPEPVEPFPVGDPLDPEVYTSYAFDAKVGDGPATKVIRHGPHATLNDSEDNKPNEGRGVQMFDLLGGNDSRFNQERVADELINHRYATGSVSIDVRPIALAIAHGFVRIDQTTNSIVGTPALEIPLDFFDTRNGMQINELLKDTELRSKSFPRRKADIQKFNLLRENDPYAYGAGGGVSGLIEAYGEKTSQGTVASLDRLRQEVFRRPIDEGGSGDQSEMNGVYIDQERYDENTEKVALFRYFLEPLGVSVDKWSLNVRGRSRTYTFADVFFFYESTIRNEVGNSLIKDPQSGITDSTSADQVIAAVNRTLSRVVLPKQDAIPTFADIQRIFNKGCIECHGGLNYPPYSNSGGILDLSEDENPPTGSSRLARSHSMASRYSRAIYSLINLAEENGRMMPFQGPPLSKADIETIRRWIAGGQPSSSGDSHIRTINRDSYDFLAAGEFVLLRDESLEVQVRQTPVLAAVSEISNSPRGLSVNAAIAMRIGPQRITYQPNLNGQPDPTGLQLRIDGKLTEIPAVGFELATGGRIQQTSTPGGIQVEIPGGSVLVITPGWWEHHRLWYLNIDGRKIRATQGLMGAVAPGQWLPALPDGSQLGPKPVDPASQFEVISSKLANGWRVNDANSLFDYAEGKTTKSYTIANWPTPEPQAAILAFDGPAKKAPAKGIAIAMATELAANIDEAHRKTSAIRDVMVTGESGFAKTYEFAEEIINHPAPNPPALEFPADGAENLADSVEFRWDISRESAGPLTYLHYVWRADESPNDNRAIAVASDQVTPMSRIVPNLSRGHTYYWKVIVDDGKGGRTESESRMFKVQK